jgi:hypothetical protein
MLSMRAFLRDRHASAPVDGRDGQPSSQPQPSFHPLPSSDRHSPDTATPVFSWAKITILLSTGAFLAGIGIGSVATFIAMLHFAPNSIGLPHDRVSASSQPDGGEAPRAGVAATASSEASPITRQWLNIPHVSGRPDFAMPVEVRPRDGGRVLILSGLVPDVTLSSGHDEGEGQWAVDADQIAGLRWALKPRPPPSPPTQTSDGVGVGRDTVAAETVVKPPASVSPDAGVAPLSDATGAPAKEAGPAAEPNAPAPAAGATVTPEASSGPEQAAAGSSAPDQAAEAPPTADAIADLVARADRQIAQKSLATPPGDNALETYQQIVALDKNDPAGPQLLARIKQTYLLWARAAEKRGQPEDARRLTERAQSLDRRFPAAEGGN